MNRRTLMRFACALLALAPFAVRALPPGTVSASYNVYRDGLPVAVVQETFERNGGKYRIVSETNPAGVLALLFRTQVKIHSSGSVVGSGLRPEQFEYGRIDDASKNVSAEFDWNAALLHMSFEGRKETAPLAAGAQDRLSAMYQFMFLPPEPAGQIVFQMTNGRKIEQYRYQFSGSEQIDTPIGRLNTLRLVKQRDPDDNGVEVWLASDHNLFPVRVLILEKDGSKFDQIITRLEFK